jgi:hypothetical protein
MSEQLRRQSASTADYSSVDTIIEEKVKEGQIAGFDLFTKDEQEQALLELAQLYSINQIAYEQQRNKLQDWFGCTKAAIDTEVKRFVDRNKPPALPKSEANPVANLVAIAKREATLWHNTIRVGYATFERDGHIENHKIDSEDFEHWLADKFGEMHLRDINGKLEPTYPSKQDLKDAIWQIQGYAKRGEERKPRIRITEYGGELWIDRGSSDWSAVVINADGWRVEPRMEAPLIRGDGMLPLPIPVAGGNIRDLRKFINLRDDAFPLLCGATASILNPYGNYLTTLISGPPGSAKTTITRIIRSLTDPDEMDTRAMASVRDLYHGASLIHLVAFENVSGLPQDMSDALCRLNTGAAYGERKYYTQGREFRLKLHCPIIINGIPPNIAEQPDLLDRTITFRCDYLGDKVRSEEALKRKFNDMLPMLFGALCDGLVGAMKARRKFGNDNDKAGEALLGGWRPRFVDAVVWAEAACQAMGFEPEEYVEAHKNNREVIFREIAENEPICIGIRKLMSQRKEWKGHPEELCVAIRPYVVLAPNGVWLSRRLPWFVPILDQIYGIEILMNKRLYKDDNRNGIIISQLGVGGKYFLDSSESSRKEEIPGPTTSESPVTKKGFPRRF